jgi:hypothetical protein
MSGLRLADVATPAVTPPPKGHAAAPLTAPTVAALVTCSSDKKSASKPPAKDRKRESVGGAKATAARDAGAVLFRCLLKSMCLMYPAHYINYIYIHTHTHTHTHACVCVCFQGVARQLYSRVLKRQQTPIAQLLRLYLGLMHNTTIYKINYVCIPPRLYFGLRHIIIIYSYYSYIYAHYMYALRAAIGMVYDCIHMYILINVPSAVYKRLPYIYVLSMYIATLPLGTPLLSPRWTSGALMPTL